ncbi:hypothetical protein A2U01_0018569, partial [Trifolium medium]|nr:hypothetical protein [Trifolium medium]
MWEGELPLGAAAEVEELEEILMDVYPRVDTKDWRRRIPEPIGSWSNFLKVGSLVKSNKGNEIHHLIWLATT